jgi:hypothetical protein
VKSPIETKLRDAIRRNCPVDTWLMDQMNHPGCVDLIRLKDGHVMTAPNWEDDQPEELHFGSDDITALMVSSYSDIKALTYRLDMLFLIQTKGLVEWLAVECDGHEWHDRTKQQAAYDRSRDRELLSLGIHTARFTGSEIHHESDRCAIEVWQLIHALRERANLTEVAYQSGEQRGMAMAQTRARYVGAFAGSLSELG